MAKIKGGFLIAIEGIDGAGKTTQVKELKKKLEILGFDVVTFKEPTNSDYAKIIRNMALHNIEHFRNPEKESEIFIMDRMIDVKDNIRPNLKNGNIVIMDRYFYSNMAYQGALGLNPDEIKKENEKIAPIPDVVFILDIPPHVGINRIIYKRGDRTNNYERKEYLEKVRSIFNDMIKHPNVRLIKGNSDRTIQEVAEDIFNETKKVLNGVLKDDRNCEIKRIKETEPQVIQV